MPEETETKNEAVTEKQEMKAQEDVLVETRRG